MSCLIYKASEFRCDPFVKPAVSASLKNSVAKYDDYVASNINRVRLERMLRNCSDVAKEEIEYLVDAFRQDPLTCINYFSDPMYFYIGEGQLKLAEFLRVKNMASEPSFLAEANSNQLGQPQLVEMPALSSELLKEYVDLCRTIRQAIDAESRDAIATSLLFLLTHKHLTNKLSKLRDFYDQIIIIFLFKACFYVDLMLQTNQDYTSLFETIKVVKSNISSSPHTMQVEENLRSSLGNRYSDKLIKIPLSESVFNGISSADHINIEKAMHTRFKVICLANTALGGVLQEGIQYPEARLPGGAQSLRSSFVTTVHQVIRKAMSNRRHFIKEEEPNRAKFPSRRCPSPTASRLACSNSRTI